MDDLSKLLESVVAGLLTGGAATITTALGVSRDIQKRLKAVEEALGTSGTPENPATGLHKTIKDIQKNSLTTKSEMDDWDHAPPMWAVRLFNKARADRSSSHDLEERLEYEKRLESKIKDLTSKVRDLEDAINNEPITTRGSVWVSREDFEEDSKARAAEIEALRKEISACSSMLKGILTALEYTNPPPRK